MSRLAMESESRPRQPKGIRRKQLQCPFTWGIPVLIDEVLEQENDALFLAPDTWALVLNKLFLAYQYVMRNDVKRSKRLLIECYIPLLQVPGFYKSDSDLIEQYRTALKHVIDSTWAFVCCKTTPVKEMEAFLQSITPYSSMTDFQKSAVRGIHGKLAYFEDGLRSIDTAIALNPNEGQWHLYRGLLIHELGLRQFQLASRVASLEYCTLKELKVLRNSYSLRVTPESTIVYALALTATPQQLHRSSDLNKGLKLLRDALTKWPANPYVNFKCGQAFHQHITKQDDLYLAERCLRNTLRLVGHGKCQQACRELGVFLITFKDTAEGEMYLQMAKDVTFH